MKGLHRFILTGTLVLNSFWAPNESPSTLNPNKEYSKKEAFETIRGLEPLLKKISYKKDSIGKLGGKTYFNFEKLEFEKFYDYWQSPRETYELGTGDCEDMAIFLNDTLIKKGLKVELFFGKMDYLDENNHVWEEFIVEGKRYILESSSGIKIYERDSLKDCNPSSYVKLENNYLTKKIKEYKKRNGKTLPFN